VVHIGCIRGEKLMGFWLAFAAFLSAWFGGLFDVLRSLR
jgi:hypothetical protein